MPRFYFLSSVSVYRGGALRLVNPHSYALHVRFVPVSQAAGDPSHDLTWPDPQIRQCSLGGDRSCIF